MALLGLGLLAFAAPWIAAATGLAALTDMIRVLALLLPLSATAGMLAALALRGRRYRLLASRVLLCQPLSVGAGMLAALAGWGAWAMVVQQATATLSVFLLLAVLSGWRPRLLIERAALAELWPVAGPQILALLVFNGRYRIFILALGTLVAETVVAVTHIAFRLLDVAMAVVTGAASRLAMPRLAALQHDRAALAEAYGDLTQLQALIGLPIAVGLAITAPQLVTLLMGGPWVAAAEPARLVALAAIPTFLIGPAPALWLALGRTRVVAGATDRLQRAAGGIAGAAPGRCGRGGVVLGRRQPGGAAGPADAQPAGARAAAAVAGGAAAGAGFRDARHGRRGGAGGASRGNRATPDCVVDYRWLRRGGLFCAARSSPGWAMASRLREA